MKTTPNMFSEECLEQLVNDISPILNQLPSGMTVMLENLFPNGLWKATSPHLHSLFGMQLNHLASKGMVRLVLDNGCKGTVMRYITLPNH